MEKEKKTLRQLLEEAIAETQATLDELKGGFEFHTKEELEREFDVEGLGELAVEYAYELNAGERLVEAGEARMLVEAARWTLDLEADEAEYGKKEGQSDEG